jgi:HSP20 family protein
MTNPTKTSRHALTTLIALLSLMPMESRTLTSTRSPRTYYYTRTQDPVGQLLSNFLSAPTQMGSFLNQNAESPSSWSPRYDVSEDPETGLVELVMEVPGLSAADLDIELENESFIRIKGSRKVKQNGNMKESAFEQVFQLDEDVDPGRLDVSLADGILSVRAPKKDKVIKKIKIAVKDSANEPIPANPSAEEGQGEVITDLVDGLEITTEPNLRGPVA